MEPEKGRLQTLANQLDLDDRVTFHGSVPRAAIHAAVASCHFFAFSSITEGQCLAALEVLACGRPLVATPVGAFSETLSDSRLGILAPLANQDAYAAALCRLGDEVMSGVRQPSQVQEAYLLRYAHDAVLDAYARLFRDLHRGPDMPGRGRTGVFVRGSATLIGALITTGHSCPTHMQ